MNLYALLEIDKSASRDEIKRAYFRLARKHTPENDPETFKMIRRAYERLSNDSERAEYDKRLSRFPNVPDEAVSVILEAERLRSKGLAADAIRWLEGKKYTDKDAYNAMQYALCETYLSEEKSGLAVKIAEKLLKDSPEDAKYLRLAFRAYNMRGWKTKAEAVKRKLRRFAPENEDDALLTLDETMLKRPSDLSAIIKNIESFGNKSPILCVNLVTCCFMRVGMGIDESDDTGDYESFGVGIDENDDTGVVENLSVGADDNDEALSSKRMTSDSEDEDVVFNRQMTLDEVITLKARQPFHLASDKKSPPPRNIIADDKHRLWNELTHAAQKLAEHTSGISGEKRDTVIFALKNMIMHGMFYIDTYEILPHINQVIKNVDADDIFESANHKCLSACYSAIMAVRAGIPKKLAALPAVRAFAASDFGDDEHRSEMRHEAFLLETDILDAFPRLKRFITRLKNEYNALYAFSGKFYDEIQLYNEHRMYKELESRLKKIDDYEDRFNLEWLGEDDDEEEEEAEGLYTYKEPIRVVKVGRNDPCPCGSGKKYKKCCGA